MRTTILVEHRFFQTPDGAVWTPNVFGYGIVSRYLDVFDTVEVLARVLPMPKAPVGFARVDGPNVTIIPIPYYVGLRGYLRRRNLVIRALVAAANSAQAVIARGTGALAPRFVKELRRINRPYGLEVASFPYNEFAPGGFRHPLRPLLRQWFDRHLKTQCYHAHAVAYVTKLAIQARYPPGPLSYSTYYSDVQLDDMAYKREPRKYQEGMEVYRVVSVGGMEHTIKGHDVLMDAAWLCAEKGLNLDITFVGDGRIRKELERKAHFLGLRSNVHFTGELSSPQQVRAELDKAHLFVMPSKSEGLPRALLEAMARGLPSIGSSVGGIPELLPREFMVSPGNADQLSEKIWEVVSDPALMTKMSADNLLKAREYHESVLRKRRIEFYRYIRDITAAWMADRDV